EVTLVSLAGQDADGQRLRQSLVAAGVGIEHLALHPQRRTLALRRVMASSQLLVRFDEGTTAAVEDDDERALVRRLAATVPAADVVIVSDYGHGVLTPSVVAALTSMVDRSTQIIAVDSNHPAAFRNLDPTVVKPNWGEALRLLGTGELDGISERADGIAAHGHRLLELTGARIAAVTLDAEGAIIFERYRPPHRTYASSRRSHPCGAGDTFTAAFALALAAGGHTPAAAELASAAASIVVAKDRTASCSARELRDRLVGAHKLAPDVDHLVAHVGAYRRQGRRIVFTNGCFDLLHRGHITYLNRAKTLGDVLVVGVNDDASVRRLKGRSRPINPFEDRAEVLTALSCVDHIIGFAEDTPSDLIRAVRPDLYVKGGDHTAEALPEVPVVEEVGAAVRILPYMEDCSTTGMIERIRHRGSASAR
ncbi:MAG: D-glycero-beta-D-manno-heptose 1-phosphate adenylyltransferase, partial [Acidimicrobiales bacterium]